MTMAETPAPELWPDIFGACPACGSVDERLNVEKCHWYVCHEHKVAWYVGDNLFSNWRHETDVDWQRNADTLKDYQEIEPLTEEPSKDLR